MWIFYTFSMKGKIGLSEAVYENVMKEEKIFGLTLEVCCKKESDKKNS